MGTLNSLPAPDVLIAKNQVRSEAVWVDVNPVPGTGRPVLLYDATAVFASLRNLFLCPIGGRGRIFQEDYGSGLYDILHEPFDTTTATSISVNLYQAIKKWEPRVIINASDIIVEPDSRLPGYKITLIITVRGKRVPHTFSIPLSGASS